MKLVWKLTLFNTLIVSLTILSLFWVFYKAFEHSLIKAQEMHLRSVVRIMEMRGYRWTPVLRRFYIEFNGKVLNDPFAISGKLPSSSGIVKVNDEYFMVLVYKKGNSTLKIASGVTPLMRGFETITKEFLLISVISISISFLIAFVLSNYSLKPLRNILQELSKVTPERFDHRLPVKGTKDEIDALSREINSMMDRLESAYRAQERFVHDVSHELRNPLTSMRGFLGVLKKWGRSDEKIFSESLAELEDLVSEMESLVNNLLILAKPFDLEVTSFDVRNLVEEVVEKLKRARTDVNVKVVGNAKLRTSREHFKILLKNLIENALKYARSRVDLFIEDGSVSVSDDGPGIPEEEKDKIFERFYRLDASRDRRAKGFGVGLAIVKELSQKLGMKVEVESEVGKGSIFRIKWGDVN